MTKPRYDVIVFDPCAPFLDIVFEGLPQMPRLGEEIFAKNLTLIPGGVFNISAGLARLGFRVALVCQIGNDLISKYLEDQLKKEGVDTSHAMRINGPARAITVSLSFPQDRAFVSYVDRTDSFDFPVNLVKESQARSLFVGSLIKDKRITPILRAAKKSGLKTFLDFHLPWGNLEDSYIKKYLSMVDVVLPNASEAKLVAGKRNIRSAAKALANHVEEGAIKWGAKGAIGWSGAEKIQIPAMKTKVVDTTGAGDSFNAGYIAAWLSGQTIQERVCWGIVCGSLSVSAAGGITAFPSASKLQKTLKKFLVNMQ